MTFELWDCSSANLIGAFESEREALMEIRRFVNAYGRTQAEAWALLAADDDEMVNPFATGSALIDRAFRTIPA